MADAARRMEERAGRLDVLVNNAGVAGGWPEAPTALTPAEAQRVVETNVIGVIRVTNALLPLLRRSAHPRIVNQSSHVGSLTLQTTPGVEPWRDQRGVRAHEDLPQRRHHPVRQRAERHERPHQQRLPRIRGDRPQRVQRHPDPRAGRSDRNPARDPAGRRPDRRIARRHWDRPLVRISPLLRRPVSPLVLVGTIRRSRRGGRSL